MQRRGWLWIGLAAFGLALLGFVVWLEAFAGCQPDCPTHKLYVAYDGSAEAPIGYGAPRVKYERAELEAEMPGLVAYLERSRTEGLVHVDDAELEAKVVEHFGFPDHDWGAPIELEGHYYVITWERLGDEE